MSRNIWKLIILKTSPVVQKQFHLAMQLPVRNTSARIEHKLYTKFNSGDILPAILFSKTRISSQNWQIHVSDLIKGFIRMFHTISALDMHVYRRSLLIKRRAEKHFLASQPTHHPTNSKYIFRTSLDNKAPARKIPSTYPMQFLMPISVILSKSSQNAHASI